MQGCYVHFSSEFASERFDGPVLLAAHGSREGLTENRLGQFVFLGEAASAEGAQYEDCRAEEPEGCIAGGQENGRTHRSESRGNECDLNCESDG